MPRQPRLDIPETLHLVMGQGIDRAKIFREQEEEDFQGTGVIVSAGDEEDGLIRSRNGPIGRRSGCTLPGSA